MANSMAADINQGVRLGMGCGPLNNFSAGLVSIAVASVASTSLMFSASARVFSIPSRVRQWPAVTRNSLRPQDEPLGIQRIITTKSQRIITRTLRHVEWQLVFRSCEANIFALIFQVRSFQPIYNVDPNV